MEYQSWKINGATGSTSKMALPIWLARWWGYHLGVQQKLFGWALSFSSRSVVASRWSDFLHGSWLPPEYKVKAVKCPKEEVQNYHSVSSATFYWLKQVTGQPSFKGRGLKRGINTWRCESLRTTRRTAHHNPISLMRLLRGLNIFMSLQYL